MTSCSALDQFCFLQEKQKHLYQTTFSHDPLKIFAHSSTTHNRFLHILPHHTTDFCASFTFFHNPQQTFVLSSHSSTTHKVFCTFFYTHNRFWHFLHILPQLTKIFVLPQPTTDFCKFFLKTQKTFVAFCVYYSTTQIPFNSIQTKTTKLRIGLPNLRAISNKTSNWVAKSVHNLEQNFELGCQICGQPSSKTSNWIAKSVCNLQTKLRIRLPNISAISLKQNFELGFQIYVQNLKSGLPNLS